MYPWGGHSRSFGSFRNGSQCELQNEYSTAEIFHLLEKSGTLDFWRRHGALREGTVAAIGLFVDLFGTVTKLKDRFNTYEQSFSMPSL